MNESEWKSKKKGDIKEDLYSKMLKLKEKRKEHVIEDKMQIR